MQGRIGSVSVVALVVSAVLLMSGCGGGSTSAFRPPPDETHPAEQVAEGGEIYAQRCAVCHAQDGSGRVGPNLRQVWERMSFDDQQRLVSSGVRAMPAFSRTLTPEEIESVVAYTRVGWSVEP